MEHERHRTGNKNPLKKHLLLPFILLFFVLPGCDSNSPADHGSSDRPWGEPSNGLRCSIILSKTRLMQGEKAIVSVRVENVSDARIDLSVIPAFVLADSIPRYVALSDITGKDPDFGHNSRLALSLDRGASLSSEIDISSLYWALMIQSSTPTKHLYEVVSPGAYTLRLDIEVVGGGATDWIRSNEVSIIIEP